ncbi:MULTISPECIES: ribosomal protein L7/L12 [unclassified Streptomyces]|uniref:ribosomal protein L7/L12 n=1 Tax=unclassified Streptomyces TaxID=2593676 RepID=UPI00403CCCDD
MTEHSEHIVYFELVCDHVDYDVVVVDAGARVLDVAKVVRRLTGLSLWRSKVLVMDAPAVVLNCVPQADAEAAVGVLREAGASAETREWQPPGFPAP